MAVKKYYVTHNRVKNAQNDLLKAQKVIILNDITRKVSFMYLHSKKYSLRYSDVDFNDLVRPSALLAVMQESACLSADELGFGYKNLSPRNIGFILSNWYVELYRPIRLNEEITVNTWPVKPKHLIVMRDFELFVGDEKVGVGSSRWCLVNLTDFSLLPSSAVFDNVNTEYNDFRSTQFSSWKIPRADAENADYVKFISYSDYDHYNHANNTKYADFLMDAFSVDELKDKWVSSFRISYIKQCKYGEKLELYKSMLEDGSWVVEGRVGDELRVQFNVVFSNV